MLHGKVNAALKFLSDENGGGIHNFTDEILSELLKKHPKPALIQDGCLLFGPVAHVSENILMKLTSWLFSKLLS